MELGHRAEIVSQTMPIVERKGGGFDRGSQIRRGERNLGHPPFCMRRKAAESYATARGSPLPICTDLVIT